MPAPAQARTSQPPLASTTAQQEHSTDVSAGRIRHRGQVSQRAASSTSRPSAGRSASSTRSPQVARSPSPIASLQRPSAAPRLAAAKSTPAASAAAAVPPKPFAVTDLLHSRWALAHASVEAVQMGAYYVLPRLFARVAPAAASHAGRLLLLGANASLAIGLPTLMMFAGQYVTFRWTKQRYEEAERTLFAAVDNRPKLWTEKSLRDFATNELTSGALSLATQSVWAGQMLITTGLRLSFAALQLSTVAWTPALVAGLAGAAMVSFVVSQHLNGNVGETVELREARNRIQESSQGFWDNMGLSNVVNVSTWRSAYTERIATLFRETWNSQFGYIVIAALEQLSYMAPMALQATAKFEQEAFSHGSPLLSERVIGRILGPVNLSLAIAQLKLLGQSLSVVKRRHATAREHYEGFVNEPDMQQRIQLDKLAIEVDHAKRHFANVDELLAALEGEPGLWRMQGENGAGKTSLLLECKKRFGAECLVLPAKHDLAFGQSGSSGQQVMAIFDVLDSLEQGGQLPKIVLLDEWNANLDHDNEEKIRAMLQRWRQSHTIVEVIHR